MAHEFGEIGYSLSEVLVSAYNITADTYADAIGNLDSDQMVEIDPQADTDELRDSGKVTRLLAVTIKLAGKISHGGYDWDVLAAICGVSNATSGTTPNRVRTTTIPTKKLGYFGLIGVMDTDDDGVIVVGVRSAKLLKRPKYTFDGTANKFVVNDDVGFTGIYVGNVLEEVKTYETASDWTAAKPTDGATFKAFFSA